MFNSCACLWKFNFQGLISSCFSLLVCSFGIMDANPNLRKLDHTHTHTTIMDAMLYCNWISIYKFIIWNELDSLLCCLEFWAVPMCLFLFLSFYFSVFYSVIQFYLLCSNHGRRYSQWSEGRSGRCKFMFLLAPSTNTSIPILVGCL